MRLGKYCTIQDKSYIFHTFENFEISTTDKLLPLVANEGQLDQGLFPVAAATRRKPSVTK